MQPKTAKRKHKRKLKRTPKRRSPIAASLRLKQNRRRVVPSKKDAARCRALDQLGEYLGEL